MKTVGAILRIQLPQDPGVEDFLAAVVFTEVSPPRLDPHIRVRLRNEEIFRCPFDLESQLGVVTEEGNGDVGNPQKKVTRTE